MRALALFAILFSLPAQAAWVSVKANHANFLYKAGDSAKLLFHKDINPADKLQLHIQYPGSAEQVADFDGYYLLFTTPALTAGEQNIGVSVLLVSARAEEFPGSEATDKVLETFNIGLTVVP